MIVVSTVFFLSGILFALFIGLTHSQEINSNDLRNHMHVFFDSFAKPEHGGAGAIKSVSVGNLWHSYQYFNQLNASIDCLFIELY